MIIPKIKSQIAKEVKVENVTKRSQFGKYRRKIKGGKLFRYCLKTSIISEAELEQSTTFKINGSNNLKLKIMPNSVYIEALNMKNALKKLAKKKIAFHTI